MRHLIHHIKHHLDVVKPIATRRVISDFADQFGLVNFGNVNHHDDEHRLIRGLTMSQHSRDRQYCVGTIQGYQIALVQRSDTVSFPRLSRERTTWLIMKFDLQNPSTTPRHILLNSYTYSAGFYSDLSFKFKKLHKVDETAFVPGSSLFSSDFDVYSRAESLPFLPHLLTPEVTDTFSEHFKKLDFEITRSRLYVYSANRVGSRNVLDTMTRAGTWLAQYIDDITH